MKCFRWLLTLVMVGVLTPLVWASTPTTQPGPDAARLSGSPGKVTENLFEVRFVEINGESIQPREFVWLEPGSYEVTVAILANPTSPRSVGARAGRDQGERGAVTIELELEAGKTYQVRGLLNKENPDQPYSVILHRIDEN